MAKKKAENLVPKELFLDNGKYADDLTVVWNGKVYKIQRGKEVMIPREVREIIEHHEAQDKQTSGMIRGMESEWIEKAKRI